MDMEKKDYIQIMIQDLQKKVRILEAIEDADERQKVVLETSGVEPEEFDAIVEEKSKYIEQLETLDQGFEAMFARVREVLDQERSTYRDEIATMQELIRTITDKSVNIRVQEQRNKELMTQLFSNIKKQVKEVRMSQKAVNQYYQGVMKKEYIEPQFWDQKK